MSLILVIAQGPVFFSLEVRSLQAGLSHTIAIPGIKSERSKFYAIESQK